MQNMDRMHPAYIPPQPSRQAGVTLIIGLMMLLLITLVVMAGARSITQESVMANNTRDRDVAFQAAEAGLLDAESRLPIFHTAFSGAGLVDTASTEVATKTTADYWTNTYGWYLSSGAVDTSKSIEMQGSVAEVDAKPRYVVERLPDMTQPGIDLGCGIGDTLHRYRVTCIAVGASSGARKSADTRVMLQAEYNFCE
jgi:type IV pilus assembly protein PilX